MTIFVIPGCQLCMGHAVDKALLSLVQIEVKGVITDLRLQKVQLSQVRGTVSEHDTRLDTVEKQLQEDIETRRKEIDGILETLVSTVKTLGELLGRVQALEEDLAATNVKVEEQGLGLEQLKDGLAKADDKVEQLKREVKCQRMKGVNPG